MYCSRRKLEKCNMEMSLFPVGRRKCHCVSATVSRWTSALYIHVCLPSETHWKHITALTFRQTQRIWKELYQFTYPVFSTINPWSWTNIACQKVLCMNTQKGRVTSDLYLSSDLDIKGHPTQLVHQTPFLSPLGELLIWQRKRKCNRSR